MSKLLNLIVKKTGLKPFIITNNQNDLFDWDNYETKCLYILFTQKLSGMFVDENKFTQLIESNGSQDIILFLKEKDEWKEANFSILIRIDS